MVCIAVVDIATTLVDVATSILACIDWYALMIWQLALNAIPPANARKKICRPKADQIHVRTYKNVHGLRTNRLSAYYLHT